MNTPIDVSSTTLRTERLLLRPWRMSDVDDIYEYSSVEGVGRMAGWTTHKNREESQRILEQLFIAGKNSFAIEYRGKVIGSLGIERYDEEKFTEFADRQCRELGFVLAKSYWGLGLMPEAVREVIRFLFEDIGLDAVFCGNFRWNTQSARVQEKCGFRFYASTQLKTAYGSIEDSQVTVLTREEWAAANTVS